MDCFGIDIPKTLKIGIVSCEGKKGRQKLTAFFYKPGETVPKYFFVINTHYVDRLELQLTPLSDFIFKTKNLVQVLQAVVNIMPEEEMERLYLRRSNMFCHSSSEDSSSEDSLPQ